LPGLLARLGAESVALRRSLPSFTCDEDAVSYAVRNGKTHRRSELTGTLRMTRTAAGDMEETYTFKGGRFLLLGPLDVPLTVSGGFDRAMVYFAPGIQACYRYILSPGRIDFVARTEASRPTFCNEPGTRGFALLDAQGEITHIERTVVPEVAKQLKYVPYAAIDIAPVSLNGRTYELSHHMVAEKPLNEDTTGHFEATYSNCRLFAATVTIGPATVVPPDTPTQSPK
jgi:hypothetical protein